MRESRKDIDTDPDSGRIEGRNAVIEALRAGRKLDKVYVSRDDISGRKSQLGYIVSAARAGGAVISQCDRRKLDALSRTGAHQGVIAVAVAHDYTPLEEIISAAKASAPGMIVVCDGITDPHNLGAIIRTAEAAGASGVVVPKHGGAGLTATVAKTSAGAVEYMPVARVPGVPTALRTLKDAGFWIFGADVDGGHEPYGVDLSLPAVIVIGSEGDGMSKLVRSMCDYLIRIPMRGKINSLNASAAAAVVLFEALRQRGI